MEKKPLIILTGPTAVGKTSLSISLAKEINAEIISADSMQVYKEMDIGTAKITEEEMDNVKHYLINEQNPCESFDVVKFQKYANKYIEEIYSKNKIPIIVGGTGFYIQSLLYQIEFNNQEEDDSNSNNYRLELETIAKEKGTSYLHSMLKDVDEKSAQTIHENNIKRVIRALEYYKITGEKISDHNEEQRQRTSPYNFIYIVLNDKRDILYSRIDKRVDKMIEDGLLDEVKMLYINKGYKRESVAMQGLGYKEIIAYLEGECSIEDAITIIKRDTRHFAKRQLTWFRRESDVTWVNKNEFTCESDILQEIIRLLKLKKIL